MARSHVCIACGTDLSRVHAPPDPYYGLPIVVCPACGTACVRRAYAGTAAWRTFGRGAGAARALLIRLLAIVALPITVLASCVAVADGLSFALRGHPLRALFEADPRVQARFSEWLTVEGVYLIPLWAVAGIATGLISVVAFPHWRLRWIPVGLVAAVGGVLLAPQVMITPTEWAASSRALVDVARSNAPDWVDLRVFLLPFAGSVVLLFCSAAAARASHRTKPRALASRRLRRIRRRRRRIE